MTPKPHRPVLAATPGLWWRPINAWEETYRSVRTAVGLGEDRRGIVHQAGCVRPASHGPLGKKPTTNFVTRWADSRSKGWQPVKVATPVHITLHGHHLYPDISSDYGPNPNFHWSAVISFRATATVTNHRFGSEEGPWLSMNVLWAARVRKNGKPIPPGNCSTVDATCSSPTLSLVAHVAINAYGPSVSAPAIAGYLRASGTDVRKRFVAACPNFTPSGSTAALVFSVPSVSWTKAFAGPLAPFIVTKTIHISRHRRIVTTAHDTHSARPPR